MTPRKRLEFARAFGSMGSLGDTIHLLAIGRSKGKTMRTVLANTSYKHISVQEAAKAIDSKTQYDPIKPGESNQNTVRGIAMTPKYQKTFD